MTKKHHFTDLFVALILVWLASVFVSLALVSAGGCRSAPLQAPVPTVIPQYLPVHDVPPTAVPPTPVATPAYPTPLAATFPAPPGQTPTPTEAQWATWIKRSAEVAHERDMIHKAERATPTSEAP